MRIHEVFVNLCVLKENILKEEYIGDHNLEILFYLSKSVFTN